MRVTAIKCISGQINLGWKRSDIAYDLFFPRKECKLRILTMQGKLATFKWQSGAGAEIYS